MSKFFSSAIRHSKHSPSIKEYPPLTESESRKIEKKVMAGQRKYKEPLPDFAQSLSKSKQSGDDRLSYFDSLKVLRAGGVPAKTVLKDQAGSIADKVLSTAMKRVALMPIAYIKPVIGSIAGIQPSKLPGAANASIQGTRGTLQLAVSGATQSLEKFSFFGRSLTPKEAEIAVPKGLVHKLENIAQDFQALAAEKRLKHSPNESATKSGDLDEFRQKVSRELTRLIEKDGGARQALFADERGFMVKQGAALFKAANAAPVIEGTGESEILETTGATEGGPSGDVKVEGNPGEAAAAEGQSVLNTVDDPLPEFGPAAALLRESRVFSRPGSQYVRNANKFKHAFDESDPNIIMSTTKTDRVYNVFRNSYKEDEWTLYSNYRYHQDGEFYANDVTAIQYEKVSKARGFYGKLPKRIVRDNVQNTETLTMTAGLGSGSPELAEAFFKTPNGRHTKRIMDDFGLEASSVDWVWGEDGVAKTFTVNVRPKTPGAASG
jgi:hypothetical protein